jgi:hypothetical protein
MKLEKSDTVVLDLLLNIAFMGTENGGLPPKAVKSKDGCYHIIGSLLSVCLWTRS